MKLHLHYLYVLLVLLLSCSKDESAPPITQENAFSCKVNGELFVPKDHRAFLITIQGIQVFVKDSTNWTFILNDYDELYIHLTSVVKTGKYSLSQSDGDRDFFNDTQNASEFHLRPSKSGAAYVSTPVSGDVEVLELELGKRIVLKFDKLVLQDMDDPAKTLELTDGKLNINLETLNKEEE